MKNLSGRILGNILGDRKSKNMSRRQGSIPFIIEKELSTGPKRFSELKIAVEQKSTSTNKNFPEWGRLRTSEALPRMTGQNPSSDPNNVTVKRIKRGVYSLK